MKSQFSKLLIVILLILTSSTCKEKCQKSINFVNNSEIELYVISSIFYPDTNSYKTAFPDPTLNKYYYKVEPNSTSNRAIRYRTCIEAKLSMDTLMIYVFEAKVLETIPWDTVKAKNLVLKRYDVSIDDIKRMNWTITYP
ncbi:MAG: hypothetical protein SNJ71_07020 [Bacteroidales bacterium]